ncbi:fructosamine kinase family protein [Nocardioides alcanivorans]|uniref:fructosamine kinase family protein n=1 Tax=Nocardioides alcanivorans TaxID=2897352 RepID=UPI001F382431|nr:fructosamine kinase family protein [Nocardioides alcanivorans]
MKVADGRTVLMKTHVHPPAGFFDAEARSLRWLHEAAPRLVPAVLAVDVDCLLLPFVETGKPTVDAAALLGRELATLHAAGAATYGWDKDGFIGRLPLPNSPAPSWAEFYATRRVLPYLKLARDRGHATPDDAQVIESVLGRLAQLVPDEPPARLHGDLWSGNVLWATDGRVWLVDPAAHGGHRETDLAMLALFGLPHLQQVVDAYEAVTPLAEGWADRQSLHQLFPLLTHAAMFGGGYASRAAALAARF